MLFIFQGAFTIGFQATVWVYPSEILPLRLRQRGSSISTGTNWIMNFLIVYITPPALENIKWRTYIIFAVLNATWVPIMVSPSCASTHSSRMLTTYHSTCFILVSPCYNSRVYMLIMLVIGANVYASTETKGLALEDVDRLFTKPGFEEGFDAAMNEKDMSYLTDKIEKV
jgi:hypothetical protein